LKLLALDTAGSASSVAVWRDGELYARSVVPGNHHSEHILPLIDEILGECGLRLAALDALACGRGPGAFTGVRLAVGLTQGLAFAAGIPVIPVSNLEAVAERAFTAEGAATRVLVCQDARMHELYWAAFERSGGANRIVGVEAIGPPTAIVLPAAWAGVQILGAGTGFDAYPELSERLRPDLSGVLSIESRAEDIARIAAGRGLAAAIDPEQLAPVYLRDEVTTPPGGQGNR
jgi:tRNA threonylcarbamoyladenosine biosynthesis protein TsaB